MLAEIYPQHHAPYRFLPILGPHLDEFIRWLRAQGYPPVRIQSRVRATKRLEAMLRERGVRGPGDLTATALLAYAPKDARDDIYLSAVVRSLVGYFVEAGLLATCPLTPAEELIIAYQRYLETARGLSVRTLEHHSRTVAGFLAFIGYDDRPNQLADLRSEDVEGFLRELGKRHCRASLQHDVAHLRSFLRFLTGRNPVKPGLDACIDTPRLYRGERLPRALPWRIVRALLRSIDRSTPIGRRDYAMLLLVATYGLRSCEVVALCLEDIEWRVARLRVRRSKVQAPLILPLTAEVGAAVLGYLRSGRPDLPCREVFLRVRAPAGTLRPTALSEVFQGWARRSGLPIPFQGPHCLRHSLAVHLLRQGSSLKAIGDLLGHRSTESTCVYLRLQIEDLRAVALPLPEQARKEADR